MLNLIELSSTPSGIHRHILSLVSASTITTTQMPDGTGDMVVYIRNATLAPSNGVPVDGVILYANSGTLNVKQSDGNNFVLTDQNRIIYNGGMSSSTFTVSANNTTFTNFATGFYVATGVATYAGDQINCSCNFSILNSSSTYGCVVQLAVFDGSTYVEVVGTTTYIPPNQARDGYAIPVALNGLYTYANPLVSGASPIIGIRVLSINSANTYTFSSAASLVVQVIRPT